MESADGGSLFYTRQNQLWRRDQRTGTEAPVRELAHLSIGRDWSISQRGIYFVPRTNDIRPVIHRYDLQTSRIEKIMELGGFPVRAVPGLSVTADERLIAVSYISYRMGDIKMASNWNRF